MVGASASGKSENVLQAMAATRARGCPTAAMLGGTGGRLRSADDIAVVVPIARVSLVQECHLILGHFLCDEIEKAFTDGR